MLTLLTPYALGGLALLAIPILVHLFRPRKVRQTPFSSLRWLHLTQQRLSRRIKWHQVLLFLLRAAFLILLVLALARPLYQPGGAVRPTERFIVLDVSRSMSYRAGDRPSPFERGKQLAAELVKHQQPGDRCAVILTGNTSQVLWPLARDGETRLATLQAVQAGATDTDLSSALPLLQPMLAHARSDAAVEVYFVTDNHQRSWNQGGIAAFARELPETVPVRVVDVSITAPQNAWIADARLLPAAHRLRVQLACIGDAEQDRTLRLSGLAGFPEQTRDVTLGPGQPTTIDFELPADFDLHGKIAHLSLKPEDGLPSDDHFYLNLDTQHGLKVLVIEGESAIESRGPGLHLRTAIESLAALNQAVNLSARNANNVTVRDITAADVIFLADVPDLTDANLTALEERVKAGAGLAIYLGPHVKPAFYNARLFEPLHPSEGLLPVPLGKITRSSDGATPLSDVRGDHPLFAGLFDPKLGDLGQVRFRSFMEFESAPAKSDNVLAWLTPQTPAIIERRVGAGTTILLNTTANDDWSDLARSNINVPFVEHLVNDLSGGGVRRTFTVGEVATLALPGLRPDERIVVIAPSGQRLTPLVQTTGGRTLLRLDAVTEAGVYHVERSGGQSGIDFVVQVGKGDSVLTPMDSATLAKWWEPADFAIVSPDTVQRETLASSGSRALWPWLVALAALVLLAEMFFVHWLCPRVNPSVTESVVQKRGLLAKSRQ